MMQPAILIALFLFLSFGLLRFLGRQRRARALKRFGEQPLHRVSHDVGIRIRLRDTRAIHGMDPRKTHLTRGDLAMSESRLILGSEKGLLLDIRDGHGRPLTSARCTGPGRLVLEGDIPDSRGERGLYRFELVTEHAGDWAKDLQRFVRSKDASDAAAGVSP